MLAYFGKLNDFFEIVINVNTFILYHSFSVNIKEIILQFGR